MDDEKLIKLGATGEFPDGKLNPDDEGEVQLAVLSRDGAVLIVYGKEVSWIGMTPEGAEELAASLIRKAAEARRQPKKRE